MCVCVSVCVQQCVFVCRSPQQHHSCPVTLRRRIDRNSVCVRVCVSLAASSLTVLLVCIVVVVGSMNATELCVGLQCVCAVCVPAV